jgi:hypothetical protein
VQQFAHAEVKLLEIERQAVKRADRFLIINYQYSSGHRASKEHLLCRAELRRKSLKNSGLIRSHDLSACIGIAKVTGIRTRRSLLPKSGVQTRRRLRLNDPQSFEPAAIETSIAREQSVGLNECMRPDEQVRHHSEPRGAALAAKLPPELPCLRGGIVENGFETDPENFHRFGKLRVVRKMCADFSPDDFANDHGSGVVSNSQRLARALPMNRIGAENIEKDGRVNRDFH